MLLGETHPRELETLLRAELQELALSRSQGAHRGRMAQWTRPDSRYAVPRLLQLPMAGVRLHESCSSKGGIVSRIPAEIQMRTDTYGDGAKGMAFQIDHDITGLGVACEARRKDRHSPFVSTWRYRWLPDRDFVSFAQLREAVNALDDAAIEAEKQRWPQPYETEREPSPTARCWLDNEQGATFTTVRSSWHEYESAPLCAWCVMKAREDPMVVLRAAEARRAWVRDHPIKLPSED